MYMCVCVSKSSLKKFIFLFSIDAIKLIKSESKDV